MKKHLLSFLSCGLIISMPLSLISCAFWSTYRFYDDRNIEQINNGNKINDLLLKSTPVFNVTKHVFILGLDGVEASNAENIIFKNENLKFFQNYAIQNWESMKGWSSILDGDILNRQKNIFGLFNKDANIKTGAYTEWTGFNNIFRTNKGVPITWKNDSTPNLDNPNNQNIAYINQAINTKFNYWINNNVIVQNNIYFAYDTVADELGHAGFNYQTDLAQKCFQDYKTIVNYYFTNQSYNPDNYLIISITDHGRNKDNLNHSFNDPLDRFSWTAANQDLNKYLTHSFINFYDLRTIVFNFMTDNKYL